MQAGTNLSRLAIYSFLAVGLIGCSGLPSSTMNRIDLIGSNVVNIRDLKPGQDNKDTVSLRGKVTRQVPLVDWRVYQLQDGTGSIWVLTKRTDVQLGEQVSLKGKVHYQSIPIANKEFGEVYVEEQQLEKIPVR
jgi:hypothetical protein